jgi:poly(3-hydroxybutyrate) depolymerase
MIIHGTHDPLVPYEGGDMRAGAKGRVLSARDSAVKWARLNGCSSEPEITHLQNRSNDSTNIRMEKYGSCKDDA